VLCISCSFGQSGAGPLNLACGEGNFGKMRSACGPHEIKYTEWRMNEKTYNCVYNSTVYFLYNMCKKNVLIITGKFDLKM